MDTSRIEFLLEQLVEKQIRLISRVDNLGAIVERGLGEISSGVEMLGRTSSEIYGKLNWWGQDPSFAKQLLGSLEYVASNIDDARRDTIGPAGYNLTDIHAELANVTSELSSIDMNIMMKD